MTSSQHIFYSSPKLRRPRLTPRELAVFSIAATLLVLMPWAWGGVVLWCTYFTLGLATAAFVAAIGNYQAQAIAAAVWTGILLFRAWGVPADATAMSVPWVEALAFPLAALFGQIIAAALLRDDTTSRTASDSLRALIRLPMFWIGLLLFAYFATQALNPWGTVVERDLFWRIGKENPIKWLPSGLSAPFSSEETDPGGMNAWRIILIFAGPWLLFCALRIGLLRRRAYVMLGWLSIIMAVIVAGYGFTHQPQFGGKIMGFPVPAGAVPFGPFIYRNHAGVYFYLQAAIALSLVFWHLRRNRSSATRGSPHLLAIFIAILLVVACFLTYSVAAAILALTLLIFITPVSYFLGMPAGMGQYSRRSSLALIIAIGVAFVILFSSNFKSIETKFNGKLAAYAETNTDSRAPWRNSTLKMATTSGTDRLLMGWGAGSYRWASPHFQSQEKQLQDAKGKLKYRATYAHCDWLQILAEWGLIGLSISLAAVVWFSTWALKSIKRGRPETIPLSGVFVLFLFNMWIDFPLWFTPMLFSAALIAAMMISHLDDTLREGQKDEAR